MSSQLVERVVVGVDQYNWATPAPGMKRPQVHSAKRGETIEVSQTEAERGEGLGFLVDPEDTETIEADQVTVETTATGAFAPASDEDLAAMSVEEITAYLGQVPEVDHDDELDRILELEDQRGKPRKGVLALGEPVDPEDTET